ncbi:unnamed protein product [Diamesa serratosioi]
MATQVQSLLIALVINVSICLVYGHVAFTFPPARKYDLDFLDNSRTPGPCGMPKGTLKTTFLSGSTFNATWHLAYPHRGGYRIQILDHLERPILDLTPSIKGSEFVRSDATAQIHQVKLPENFTCSDCTLRLLRQADEWSNGYRFWSCADIDIQPRKLYREQCSGHGKYLATKCKCDKNYYGPRCQYWDECTVDQDCGSQGKCIHIGGTALPRKQCYCKLGFFGTGCNKKSIIKSTDIDYSLYTTKVLSPDYRIHWRILKEQKEIEMILVVNGTSWVGFGWRSRKLTAECRKFPLLQDIGSVAEPASVPEPSSTEPSNEQIAKSPSAEPKSKPEPVSFAEPSAEVKPTSLPATEHISKAEPLAQVSPKDHAASGSSKTKRVASPEIPSSKDEYTVSTSVTYKVSTVTGRRKRAVEKENANMKDIVLTAGPISEPESTSKPKSETVSEPASESTAEPASEPETTSESKSEPSLSEAEPTSEPLSVQTTPEPISEASVESTSEPETTSEPKSEPTTTAEPSSFEPITNNEPISEPKDVSEPKFSDKTLSTLTAKTLPKDYTPKHDFNPMDCTDIVIGTAQGELSRVWDYYTRDRSTPRMDNFWGGKSELQATGGFEKDGVTTIIFRKKLEATEPSDHTIEDDMMHVVWAKGQEPGKYVHFPPSGLEKEAAGNQDFYQTDELKYHGHKLQRGYTQINFFDEEKAKASAASAHELDHECHGHWKAPRDCLLEKHNCEYFISWETVGKGDEIRFHLETTNVNTWTGVGFSDNRAMSQTDAIIGWVDQRTGRPFLMDTWISGYSAPLLDESQGIYNASGSINNGVTVLDFTRKRLSEDKHDVSFTDEHCVFMMFPVKGGAFNAVNKKTRKHEDIPIITDNRICIKSCGLGLDSSVGHPTTPTPNRLAYAVSMKLINLADGFDAPKKGSQEYDDLSRTIQESLSGVLGNIPGYYKLEEIQFKKNDDGMIAKMNVLFDKAMYEKGRSLDDDDNKLLDEGKMIEKTIKESLASGKVGSLTVDPNFLDFEPLGIISAIPEEASETTLASFFKLSETRLFIVLGCIAALVLVALLQATCTIYKTSKKSNRHKLIPNSAWKDYSANTNYAFDAFADQDEKSNGKARNGANSRSSTATIHNGVSQQTTLQMSHSPNKAQYYDISRNGNRYGGVNGDQRSYSLPRTAIQPQNQMAGYYTQDRRNRSSQHPNGTNNHNNHHSRQGNGSSDRSGADTPDFYFMPSQRKYSGEVVRVYVDYNKDPK